MAFENITKDGNFNQAAVGDYGFRYLTTSESTSDSCRAIQALEDSSVTTTTTSGDALTEVIIPTGTVVWGKFDSVSVVAGKVIAYKAS
jgi:hypothetical protein